MDKLKKKVSSAVKAEIVVDSADVERKLAEKKEKITGKNSKIEE